MKKVLKALAVLVVVLALVTAASASPGGGGMHGRRVNFALGPNDGVIQPSPLPIWGSCAGECSNYDGHFPFVTMITGVDYELKYWYPGVAPYTAGVFRTLKKGVDVPLTLWLQENPADGKMYYCNVALEDGRDYVMSGGMDCD